MGCKSTNPMRPIGFIYGLKYMEVFETKKPCALSSEKQSARALAARYGSPTGSVVPFVRSSGSTSHFGFGSSVPGLLPASVFSISMVSRLSTLLNV